MLYITDVLVNIKHCQLVDIELYVTVSKAQNIKFIRETPQLDLDRCLTSSLVQFVVYFKYKIIEAYNTVCNIRNCYVCQ